MANSLSRKLESGIVSMLNAEPAFSGVSIYAHHDSSAATDTHPTIIIHCESAERDSDLPLEMEVYKPNIKSFLYWDNVDGDSSATEECLEEILGRLSDLQETFNLQDPPITRPVEGVHVHYIESMASDSESNGSIMQFTVEQSLIVEKVIS